MRDTTGNGFVFPQVRRGFWLLLAATLLLSLALPLGRFWSEATSHLDVKVAVSPAIPRLGAPVHLIITLPQAVDRAALNGPWAHLIANWDMTAMRMGQHSTALSGPSVSAQTAPSFVVPLSLDMPGQWVAHVALTTPGRPEWEDSLRFTLLPATSTASERSSP